MTGLISASARNVLKWDSIERCIIASALVLRATNKRALLAISDGVPETEVTQLTPKLLESAVSIAYRPVARGEQVAALVIIEAKLYYDQLPALLSGMNLKDNLIPYSVLFPSDFVVSAPSLVAIPLLPEFPSQIETLEQFFLHCVNLLGEYTYPDIKYFGSQLFDGAEEPYLSVSINLPLDYQTYCRTQNFIESSVRVITSTNAIPSTETRITNSFLVTNNTYFKN